MKYISERSNLELRENELFSKNKSLLRGENTQTIQYSRINKIEILIIDDKEITEDQWKDNIK
jgi:hypothetical protein